MTTNQEKLQSLVEAELDAKLAAIFELAQSLKAADLNLTGEEAWKMAEDIILGVESA